MIDFKKEIARKIAEVTKLNQDELEQYVEIPPSSDLGDYAFPCFRLAKELHNAPADIAYYIREKMNIEDGIIDKLSVDGGYLNIFVNKQTLVRNVLEEINAKRERYGSCDIGAGRNVVIDYSAPNIAKSFHIGHLRSTVIGGALYKIYNFLGYNSVGINYLGDWGLQFGKVMAGYELWKKDYDFKKSEIDAILKIYTRFTSEEKEKPHLTDLAREHFKKLEDGDPKALETWEWIRRISLEHYEITYKMLNSKFDSYNGEAYYNDKMDEVIQELRDKNLLKESEGAQIVDLSPYDMPPCIVLTSSGTTIYATRDLASLKDRMRTYDFEKAIYVVGNEQQLHFKQVFKVFELMGYHEYSKKCVHVPFGLVVDRDGQRIGTRKGNSVFLQDILNEAIDKVRNIINEKNPDLKEKDEIAKRVGVGAIIFNDLSSGRMNDEIFEWDTILNFQGETGPYIQYIYVRTKSVIEKAEYIPKIEDINPEKLTEKEVISIFKLLYNFGEVIKSAADKNEPAVLARYLIDLAQSYSIFYNEHKIIVEDKELQNSRLYLSYITGMVLKTGTELLGMEMPDKM